MLTSSETKAALKSAIHGWIVELEAGAPADGALCQFVAQIPSAQPKAFALAYMVVSDSEPQMIEIHRLLSAYFEAGMPEMDKK